MCKWVLLVAIYICIYGPIYCYVTIAVVGRFSWVWLSMCAMWSEASVLGKKCFGTLPLLCVVLAMELSTKLV